MTYNILMRKLWYLFIIVIILAGCVSGTADENTVLAEKPGKTFKSGMTLKYTDRGNKIWEIFAETLNQKEEETSFIYAEGIRISFYGESGLVENIVEADNAQVDLSTNDVVLTENVVLKNIKKGTTAYMEKLNYIASQQRVYSESAVKIEKNGGFVEGTGMEMDLSTDEISIKEPHGRN